MHKKFEIHRTKIKGGCHLGRKLIAHNSKSDLPLGLLCCKILQNFRRYEWVAWYGLSYPGMATPQEILSFIQGTFGQFICPTWTFAG